MLQNVLQKKKRKSRDYCLKWRKLTKYKAIERFLSNSNEINQRHCTSYKTKYKFTAKNVLPP